MAQGTVLCALPQLMGVWDCVAGGTDVRQRGSKNAPVVAGLCVNPRRCMTGLVAYSPSSLPAFLPAATGIWRHGAPRRSGFPQTPSTSDEIVTVHFDANVHPGLDWEFRSRTAYGEGRRFGEPVKVYYYAKNAVRQDARWPAPSSTSRPIRLLRRISSKSNVFASPRSGMGPGESARMPLVLYLDGADAEGQKFQAISGMSRSPYTFFRQDGLTPDEVKAARDLSGGSKALEQQLDAPEKVALRQRCAACSDAACRCRKNMTCYAKQLEQPPMSLFSRFSDDDSRPRPCCLFLHAFPVSAEHAQSSAHSYKLGTLSIGHIWAPPAKEGGDTAV